MVLRIIVEGYLSLLREGQFDIIPYQRWLQSLKYQSIETLCFLKIPHGSGRSLPSIRYSIFDLSTNHDSFDWITKRLFRRERFHYCSFCWESDTISLLIMEFVDYIITWASDDYYKLLALTGHGLNVAKESPIRWCWVHPIIQITISSAQFLPSS